MLNENNIYYYCQIKLIYYHVNDVDECGEAPDLVKIGPLNMMYCIPGRTSLRFLAVHPCVELERNGQGNHVLKMCVWS
jgi:hypothetical protein